MWLLSAGRMLLGASVVATDASLSRAPERTTGSDKWVVFRQLSKNR